MSQTPTSTAAFWRAGGAWHLKVQHCTFLKCSPQFDFPFRIADEKDADEHGDVDFGELAARGRAMRRAMRQSMQDAGGSEREPGQTMEDYRRMWRRSRRGGGGSE